jgi:hypothetical protein
VSRRLSLGLAALALLLAAGFVVLAIDARRAADELHRGDALFERSSSIDWGGSEVRSLGPGRRMTGIDDDVAFRRAVTGFMASRPDPASPAGSLAVAKKSRAAERALIAITKGDPDRTRRAMAANLLGILSFEAGRANPEAATTLQARTLDQFRAALKANPEDEAAKFNLELALSLFGQGGLGTQGNGRGNQAATVGAVVSPVGSGY